MIESVVNGYGYMRLSADRRMVFVHWPDCKAFEAVEMEKMGVEIDYENEKFKRSIRTCDVPSVEVLDTLIKNYINDPKNAETIKSREHEGTFIMTTKSGQCRPAGILRTCLVTDLPGLGDGIPADASHRRNG